MDHRGWGQDRSEGSLREWLCCRLPGLETAKLSVENKTNPAVGPEMRDCGTRQLLVMSPHAFRGLRVLASCGWQSTPSPPPPPLCTLIVLESTFTIMQPPQAQFKEAALHLRQEKKVRTTDKCPLMYWEIEVFIMLNQKPQISAVVLLNS